MPTADQEHPSEITTRNRPRARFSGKPTKIPIPWVLSIENAILQKISIRKLPILLTLPTTPCITATGLAVFAANLERTTAQVPDGQIAFDPPPTSEWLGVCSFLSDILGPRMKIDLFCTPSSSDTLKWKTFSTSNLIVRIKNIPNDRDSIVKALRSVLANALDLQQVIERQKRVLYLFTELVKNTLDHTEHDAFLGIESSLDGVMRKFAYCEVGPGMSVSIRRLQRLIATGRPTKDAMTDLIHWALKPGNTTKPESQRNMGMGMTIISESAAVLGFSLTMFDADSQITISDIEPNCSHRNFRRRSAKTGPHPCFMYVGERINAL